MLAHKPALLPCQQRLPRRSVHKHRADVARVALWRCEGLALGKRALQRTEVGTERRRLRALPPPAGGPGGGSPGGAALCGTVESLRLRVLCACRLMSHCAPIKPSHADALVASPFTAGTFAPSDRADAEAARSLALTSIVLPHAGYRSRSDTMPRAAPSHAIVLWLLKHAR